VQQIFFFLGGGVEVKDFFGGPKNTFGGAPATTARTVVECLICHTTCDTSYYRPIPYDTNTMTLPGAWAYPGTAQFCVRLKSDRRLSV